MQIQISGSLEECESVASHYLQMQENESVMQLNIGRIHYIKDDDPHYEVAITMLCSGAADSDC